MRQSSEIPRYLNYINQGTLRAQSYRQEGSIIFFSLLSPKLTKLFFWNIWSSPFHVFLELRTELGPLLCSVKGGTKAKNGWQGVVSYSYLTEVFLQVQEVDEINSALLAVTSLFSARFPPLVWGGNQVGRVRKIKVQNWNRFLWDEGGGGHLSTKLIKFTIKWWALLPFLTLASLERTKMGWASSSRFKWNCEEIIVYCGCPPLFSEPLPHPFALFPFPSHFLSSKECCPPYCSIQKNHNQASWGRAAYYQMTSLFSCHPTSQLWLPRGCLS